MAFPGLRSTKCFSQVSCLSHAHTLTGSLKAYITLAILVQFIGGTNKSRRRKRDIGLSKLRKRAAIVELVENIGSIGSSADVEGRLLVASSDKAKRNGQKGHTVHIMQTRSFEMHKQSHTRLKALFDSTVQGVTLDQGKNRSSGLHEYQGGTTRAPATNV